MKRFELVEKKEILRRSSAINDRTSLFWFDILIALQVGGGYSPEA
jgi:hypothetical protein